MQMINSCSRGQGFRNPHKYLVQSTRAHTHTVLAAVILNATYIRLYIRKQVSVYYIPLPEYQKQINIDTHSVAPLPLIVFPSGMGLSWIGSGFLLFCMLRARNKLVYKKNNNNNKSTHELQQCRRKPDTEGVSDIEKTLFIGTD